MTQVNTIHNFAEQIRVIAFTAKQELKKDLLKLARDIEKEDAEITAKHLEGNFQLLLFYAAELNVNSDGWLHPIALQILQADDPVFILDIAIASENLDPKSLSYADLLDYFDKLAERLEGRFAI